MPAPDEKQKHDAAHLVARFCREVTSTTGQQWTMASLRALGTEGVDLAERIEAMYAAYGPGAPSPEVLSDADLDELDTLLTRAEELGAAARAGPAT